MCHRGVHGPDFSGSGPARMTAISARPEREIEISAQLGQFFSDFGPDCSILSEFKTGTHNKRIFADDLFF